MRLIDRAHQIVVLLNRRGHQMRVGLKQSEPSICRGS